MDTKLRRIFKKLLGSHLLNIQDIFGRNEKETEWSAEYQLSIVRKKEEAIAKTEVTSSNSKSNIPDPTESRRTPKKDLLVPKKALIWDPRVRDGLLTSSQLFNINQWLLSLENLQPFDLQDMIESTNNEEDPVDEVDRMLDSFQDFGGSINTRRLTTLV